VIERHEIADLGLVTVRFANNVRLIVKPTKFSDDQVMVGAYVGNGLLGLPFDKPSAKWATDAFLAGGLKAIDFQNMGRALESVVGSIEFAVDDRAFKLTGTTRPSDLLAQLQLLAAYASDPGFRPEAFSQTKAAFLSKLSQVEGTAESVVNRDLPALVRSNDPRWSFPTREQIEATTPDALQKLLGPALAAGPLDVIIVGNVKADEAINLVAQTFGALPKRDLTPPSPAAFAVHFPEVTAAPILRTHKGRADQAIALVAWPTSDYLADTAHARALFLAGDILENRVLEAIRIAEGATYSPESSVDQSTTFPGFGYAYSYVETPPSKVESFFAHVEEIIDDMKANGVTVDELVRAKKPEVEAMKKERLTNAYWLGSLADASADPRALDLIRSKIAQYEQVTPTDIQAVVTTFLAGHRPLRLIVLPEVSSKL
jgi:zinc protease